MADSGAKATTEFVYFFIKAKIPTFIYFFPNVIRFTCTFYVSACSGIQLPSLTVEAQTNK